MENFKFIFWQILHRVWSYSELFRAFVAKTEVHLSYCMLQTMNGHIVECYFSLLSSNTLTVPVARAEILILF